MLVIKQTNKRISWHEMIPVILIATVTCIGLITVVLCKPSITIKNHNIGIYWMIVLMGAVVMICSRKISLSEVFSGLTADTAVNPLKILILFLSMSTLSIFLDEIGFFRYLANQVLKRAKTSQKILFFYLYFAVSVLTVFTSNDIIILTFTPFICYFTKHAKINPFPYLFAEFVAANTWSMLLVIGNPTNVYLATANGIDFIHYLTVMLVPSILGGLAALFSLYLVFHRMLQKPMVSEYEEVRIQDKGLLGIGLGHLSACTILLVLSSYIHLEMWLITICFALSLFLTVFVYQRMKKRQGHELVHCLKRVPWELIPFIISMFVIVLALDKYQITGMIAAALNSEETVFSYGISSFITANLINNIPMSVLFGSVVQNAEVAVKLPGIYAAIIGSNVGAIFTPIGALAGIMWTGILKEHQIDFNFRKYIRYGLTISMPTLMLALFGLWLVM